MSRIVLVTDSSADLPAAVVAGGGVSVVRAQYAFDERTFSDGEQPAVELYARMKREGRAPRPFGAPEAAFREAFRAVLTEGAEPLCVVTPFDVNPSFTTAVAAQLSIDEAKFKVVNGGVGSAGLCALVTSLLAGVRGGWGRQQVLDALDRLAPQCDTMFVPAGVAWLERAGRLPLVEDRIGSVGEAFPVVRAGTRITGVALANTHDDALAEAVQRAGARVEDGQRLVVAIDHADDRALAAKVEAMMRERWPVAQAVVTELSATIGAQVGPGAVGIGVAPAIEV
jgi:DegV family protein with EDD domain